MTLVNMLSQYPFINKTRKTIAKASVEKIVLIYGTPRILQTDGGANFISEVFRATCTLLRIKKIQ